MRNGIVMLLAIAFSSGFANAQTVIASQTPTVTAVAEKALPESLLKLLPVALLENVARWENTDEKGQSITGWYSTGQKAVAFSQKGGHLHGLWQAWHENGKPKEQGHFSKGYPDGSWQFWYASGTLKSTRSFSASKLQSMAIANRQRNPKLQFVPVTGNEPSSKETTALNLVITDLSHGLLHVDLPFRRALNEGDFVNYAEDGSIVEQGKFSNGLRDGKWLYQNQADHKIITGYYSNGLKHGPWKEMKGEAIITLSEYKDGKIVFQKHYPDSEGRALN